MPSKALKSSKQAGVAKLESPVSARIVASHSGAASVSKSGLRPASAASDCSSAAAAAAVSSRRCSGFWRQRTNCWCATLSVASANASATSARATPKAPSVTSMPVDRNSRRPAGSRSTLGHRPGSATKAVRSPATVATKTGLPSASADVFRNSSGAAPKATALPRTGTQDQTTGGSPGRRRFW